MDIFMDVNLDKYIQWNKLWCDEVDVQSNLDDLDDNDAEFAELLKQFMSDKDVSLINDECQINGDKFIFSFAETGGQNESDTQGWSRIYTIEVDDAFNITDIDYSQG